MYYAYEFKTHDLRELHSAVCVFVRRLYYDSHLDPENFDVRVCCSGELLIRASTLTPKGEEPKLLSKLRAFYLAWFKLEPNERKVLYQNFRSMNRIEGQLQNVIVRSSIDDVPTSIRACASDLFGHLYESSLLRSRCKSYWEQFYNSLPVKTCPFCGIEPMHHYDLYKQDFDHALCKMVYPLASVNIKNLIPCGRDCNQIFKHEVDTIFVAGRRRKAYFPFHCHDDDIWIDLNGSRVPSRGDDRGDWVVEIRPDVEEVNTWVEVFNLKNRYRLEVFGDRYDRWRDDFLDWLAPQQVPAVGWTADNIRECMKKFSETLESDPLIDLRFFKRMLFLFLISQPQLPVFGALAAQLNSRHA